MQPGRGGLPANVESCRQLVKAKSRIAQQNGVSPHPGRMAGMIFVHGFQCRFLFAGKVFYMKHVE
jgi:hypothetical protein